MKKIVIIGGGFAGAYCAKKLEDDFDVTLIDAKDYFEFTPAILRTIVEPKHIKKIQVLHRHYLHKAHIIQDEAQEVTDTHVLTAKENIPFDYLIVCSGSTYNTPIKAKNMVIATRASKLRDYSQKLSSAQSVLIVGGGLVGVELAAEIADGYKDKKITIVHAKENLIERNHHKAIHYAHCFLRKRGVEIIFNERVVEHKEGLYRTDKGKEFKPDLAFLCTGIQPNYEFLTKHFGNKLSDQHKIHVNNHLQIEGHERIFAAGDITDRNEEKTAQNAERQAATVVHNIYHREQGEQLEEYRSESRPMLISLGKWKGIFTYKKFVLTGIIPAFLKTFVERKTMNRYAR